MTVFVDAWDTRTGQKVRNANGGKVPLSWIRSGLFPYLSDRPPAPPEPEPEPEPDPGPSSPQGQEGEPAQEPQTGSRSQSAARSGKKEQ